MQDKIPQSSRVSALNNLSYTAYRLVQSVSKLETCFYARNDVMRNTYHEDIQRQVDQMQWFWSEYQRIVRELYPASTQKIAAE